MPSLGNVTGFATGFSGVRVRVGNSIPPKNPYPWHGFWVTHTVTRHMRDLPLGHQRRCLTGTTTTLTLATTTTFHSGTPQDEQQHDGKRAMGRMTRAGEGPSCPPPIVRYVSYIFLIFPTRRGGVCPSSLRFCCFDATRRGIYPSSSCRSSFDMAGRGTPPPHHVFVSFLTHRGGVCPSSLRFCCFDAMRRGIYPSSSCRSSFDMAGRGMPPP